jgi:hypothetical protein
MVHCGIVTTYTLHFDVAKDYVVVRSSRDQNEVGRIPYRIKLRRDGSGLVTVSNIDNSTPRDY